MGKEEPANALSLHKKIELEKQIRLFNQTVDIDPNRVEYNRIRLIFQQEAMKAVKIFQNEYEKHVDNDNFIDKVPQIIEGLITHAIESKCINDIVSRKFYELDTSSFIQIYGEGIKNIWWSRYEPMAEALAAIDQRENQLDAYRVARRENRGRWVGGGFGMSGAISGAIDAGVLNTVSGIGHGIFNGFAKAISSIKASGEKSKIINDEGNVKHLTESVGNAVFALHLCLIDFLAKKGIDSAPYQGIVSNENSKTAAAILSNAKHIANQDELTKVLVKSFSLNPYNVDWYLFALEKCGDSNGELEQLESYFGLSAIKDIKSHKVEEFVETLSIENENEAINSSRLLSEYKRKLGFNGTADNEHIITDAVAKFDEEYRTICGITLPTRQEATENRAVVEKLHAKFVEYTQNASGKALEEGEKQFKLFKDEVETGQYPLSVKNVFIEKADKSLREIDKTLRTEFSFEYNTREEARKAKRDYEAIVSRIKVATDLSCIDGISTLIIQGNFPNKTKQSLLKQLRNKLNEKFATYTKLQEIGQQIAGCGCLLIIVGSIVIGYFFNSNSGWMAFIAGIIVFVVVGSFGCTILSDDKNQRLGAGCISIVTLIAAAIASYSTKPEYLPWVIGFTIVFIVASIIAKHRRSIKNQYAKHIRQAFSSMNIDNDDNDDDDEED